MGDFLSLNFCPMQCWSPFGLYIYKRLCPCTYLPVSLFYTQTAKPISTKFCTDLHTNSGKVPNTSLTPPTWTPDPGVPQNPKPFWWYHLCKTFLSQQNNISLFTFSWLNWLLECKRLKLVSSELLCQFWTISKNTGKYFCNLRFDKFISFSKSLFLFVSIHNSMFAFLNHCHIFCCGITNDLKNDLSPDKNTLCHALDLMRPT